jgi:16S rRNA (guanine(966)-N(2))-methyltransferase RsmD
MRVTGGQLTGRKLAVPRGDVRPTADRVRESLFAILSHRGVLSGARVLDAFAGSGALGIECLSRGAQSAVFLEAAPRVAAVLEGNLAGLGLAERARILRGDARAALGRLAREGARFELILADPPYASALARAVLEKCAALGLASAGALLVAETDRRHPPGPLAGLSAPEERRYGDTLISLYSVSTEVGREGGRGA